MIILHIETSTHLCSVALSKGHKCIFSRQNTEGMNHAALLSVFIEEAFLQLKSLKKKPDAIAVSSGPGSYTGLRIGVSTAKGLCYGLNIPLIQVSTLEIMTLEALQQLDEVEPEMLFVPMIDARRMEVYSAIYDKKLTINREVAAEIITEDSYAELLSERKLVFFGNGASKCMPLIVSENAIFLNDVHPLAINMIKPAILKMEAGAFEDVAYFEPFYLKEFFTTAKIKD
jgi:tRNA threonylcarbamoyladenosine biosynthesis protein TsaB